MNQGDDVMGYFSLALMGAVVLGAYSAVAEQASTFGEDLAFLKEHVEVIVLSDETNAAQVAVVPAYQGRVMTSTASGAGGGSYGWINRELIASGEIQPHMNAYGGEDRFWMGPEAGQFGIFFPEGAPFDLDHWQTPPSLDTEPFDTLATSRTEARFRRQATFTNHSGTAFDVLIERTVRLVNREQAARHLGVPLSSGLQMVAYETDNTITNKGADPWRKETGLLSIWILGMFSPSPATTAVIPFVPGPEAELGPIVNDAYFGKVPEDRLAIKDGVIFFRGDGNYRSKIGVGPQRAKPVLGSFGADTGVLTLVQYTKPEQPADYVNSMWEIQDEPYNGDVVNAYNDGPPAPGKKPLGPFYELESSSPAAALDPDASISHISRTFHIQGPESELDGLTRALLNVSLEQIRSAF
jgi:hypothetical protein